MKERIPPHNEEAERCALGAAMLSREALFDVIETVKADDFYNESHREIFKAIMELYRDNKPVDMLTVCEELKTRKALEMVGGRAYVATLTSEVPSTVNAGEYAKIVSEKATLRQLIDTAGDIMNKSYDGKDDPEQILNFAESGIFQIGQKRQKSDYTPIRKFC